MTVSTLENVRAEVVLGSTFWRQRLLTPEELAKLAKNLGLGSFTATDITGLWKIGLLRADLVMSDEPIDFSGLSCQESINEDFKYIYCDFRRPENRPEGYGSLLQDHKDSALEGSLAFHPFRVYVLHHIKRTLKISISNMQYLRYQQGITNVIQCLQEHAQHWTSSVEFADRFDYWNQIVETAAVTEQITYRVVFRDAEPTPIGTPAADNFEHSLHAMLLTIGKSALQEMRSDLAFAAENLDENRSVHVLLRLMKWQERERLKGQLGCSMLFLAMAESIRRSSEQAFAEAWPEEDEIGPGTWIPNARKMLYGSERVFDAPKRVLRDYMAQLGLDFGIKVRCYVEGNTEFGALSHAVGSFDHIQLINLSGHVAEKRGKGLAFVESLEADKNLGIFSVVLLDGDLQDYLRILRKAADDERFHGRFFISDPDIECGNFSANELIETGIREYQKNSPNGINMALDSTKLFAEADTIKSNNDLSALFAKHGIGNLQKSESWGKALMDLAIMRPEFPAEDNRVGQKRSIVEAAELLIRMRDIKFSLSTSLERIDSHSGRVVSLAPKDN
ncbi:hypothetical protein HA050_09110 [Iodobacter sp. HSC-16F04]|uniref:Uncharacterized protein n=1 Tax=Iodobacter violaceini TaxID=3044271 RepID=A0ABX0KRI3_9NEIS|nr:hypothetical protein [Iodobacter violacea]NHQ86274.1 hypothetical protein [Iodobacter violacea]